MWPFTQSKTARRLSQIEQQLSEVREQSRKCSDALRGFMGNDFEYYENYHRLLCYTYLSYSSKAKSSDIATVAADVSDLLKHLKLVRFTKKTESYLAPMPEGDAL